MNKFDEVVKDIIDVIGELNYDDVDKRIIQTDIMFNLYKMLESKEVYDNSINLLMRKDEKAKMRKLIFNS